jgi:hypothetical protein
MNETFKRFIDDEFKPEVVYCMFNGEPRSIKLNELSEYKNYSVTGIDSTYNLPVLTRAL